MNPRGRIGMGLVGPGFVGAHHIDAVRRLGFVDVVAVAASSDETAARKAEALGISRSYGSFEALAADPDVHVIHNTTPNHLHTPVIMAVTFVFACLVVIFNLIADVLYGWLDPRISYS